MNCVPPPVVVLVVDDEPLIRMNTADFLVDSGFTAIEADNAEHAMEQLDAHPEITVLFTDINMPGAYDGLDLARKVYARRPDIQLIITSGKMRPSEGEIPDHGAFFSKPYSGRAVAQMIIAGQHPSPDRPAIH